MRSLRRRLQIRRGDQRLNRTGVRIKTTFQAAVAASLLLSGCVTRAVWEEADSLKYKTVKRGSVPDEEFERLVEKRNAKLRDVADPVVPDDDGVLVLKRKISRVSLDAAKFLATPVALSADIVLLLGWACVESALDPENWFDDSGRSDSCRDRKEISRQPANRAAPKERPPIFRK